MLLAFFDFWRVQPATHAPSAGKYLPLQGRYQRRPTTPHPPGSGGSILLLTGFDVVLIMSFLFIFYFPKRLVRLCMTEGGTFVLFPRP